MCWDATRGLPLPDRWLGGVFSEHMIEHIPFEQAQAVLRELKRVMKPGAWLRIVVPGLEAYTEPYEAARRGGPDEMPVKPAMDGDYTPAMAINEIFYDWGHRFIYDAATLELSLRKAGFTEVERRSFGEGADPRLLIDTPERRHESIYVEARV
jgi:predicted SAM-dependent methyltransferase